MILLASPVPVSVLVLVTAAQISCIHVDIIHVPYVVKIVHAVLMNEKFSSPSPVQRPSPVLVQSLI